LYVGSAACSATPCFQGMARHAAALQWCKMLSTTPFVIAGQTIGLGLTFDYTYNCGGPELCASGYPTGYIFPIKRVCLVTGWNTAYNSAMYVGGILVEYWDNSCTQISGNPTNCMSLARGEYITVVQSRSGYWTDFIRLCTADNRCISAGSMTGDAAADQLLTGTDYVLASECWVWTNCTNKCWSSPWDLAKSSC
jgi:hypothetical protein